MSLEHNATQQALQERLENLDEQRKTAMFQKVKLNREKEHIAVVLAAKTQEANDLHDVNKRLTQDLDQSNAKLLDSEHGNALLHTENTELQRAIEQHVTTIQTLELRTRSGSAHESQKLLEDAQHLQTARADLLHKDHEIAQLYPPRSSLRRTQLLTEQANNHALHQEIEAMVKEHVQDTIKETVEITDKPRCTPPTGKKSNKKSLQDCQQQLREAQKTKRQYEVLHMETYSQVRIFKWTTYVLVCLLLTISGLPSDLHPLVQRHWQNSLRVLIYVLCLSPSNLFSLILLLSFFELFAF